MRFFFDRVFPVLFVGVFTIATLFIVLMVSAIVFFVYQFAVDAEGTANLVGTLIGEGIRPIVDVFQGDAK